MVDAIVAEPGDGAHTDDAETGRAVKAAIVWPCGVFPGAQRPQLPATRYARLRGLGAYVETGRGQPGPSGGPVPPASDRPHSPPARRPATASMERDPLSSDTDDENERGA